MKKITVEQNVLLLIPSPVWPLDRASAKAPGRSASGQSGREVTSVKEVPGQESPVQYSPASDQTSQIATPADAIRASQASVPRPVRNIVPAPAIISTTRPTPA